MNDVITQDPTPVSQPASAPVPYNPFGRMQASHINAGTVAIESERAVADSQVKMLMAQRFPRDEAAAFAKAMAACQRPSLASAAFYSYPRGGETISGPTIRLAEELARCWGRIDHGIRELSRNGDVSEMQAYAIDLENLVYVTQNFTVRHVRDTRSGQKKLTDERDVYELTANQGARRKRACIMAVLPPDLKEAAIDQCRKTIAGGGGVPISDRVKRMVVAFAGIGVSDELLVKRLGHKLDTTTPDELADLHGIFTSLKDGVSKIADWFGDKPADGTDGEGEPDRKAGIANVVNKQAKAAAEKAKAAEKPAEAAPASQKQKSDKNEGDDVAQGKAAKNNSKPEKEQPSEPVSNDTTNSQPTADEDGPVF